MRCHIGHVLLQIHWLFNFALLFNEFPKQIVCFIASKSVEIRSKSGKLRATNPYKSLKAVIGNTINALPGVPIEIQCPHVAFPKANITWYFKSKVVKANSDYMIAKVNNALYIPKMLKVHAGRYTCEATQGKIKVSATSTVYLTGLFLHEIYSFDYLFIYLFIYCCHHLKLGNN